jgi:ubiquinone/menaquinone biosynthesis C-methylase UbiE
MEYEKLSTAYTGGVASSYEARRTGSADWPKEQAAVERFLAGLPAGSSIVDVPVGTGRFLEFYKRFGLKPVGRDISLDMLASAKSKADALTLDIDLAKGDIRKLDIADRGVDTALCVRFVNWVDFAGFETAMKELARVAKTNIIVSVRVWPTPRTFANRIGQAWTAFRRRNADLHFHNTEATEALFARIGFPIVAQQNVRAGKDQTNFVFYLLRRAA